jgi:hypothetical protein
LKWRKSGKPGLHRNSGLPEFRTFEVDNGVPADKVGGVRRS